MNVLPLGSYDIIIGMDWLEKYKVVYNFFDKNFSYVAEDKIVRKLKGFSKLVSLRQISSLQLRKCLRKGCKLYEIKVDDLLLNENPTSVRDHLVLNGFMDVFPEVIP